MDALELIADELTSLAKSQGIGKQFRGSLPPDLPTPVSFDPATILEEIATEISDTAAAVDEISTVENEMFTFWKRYEKFFDRFHAGWIIPLSAYPWKTLGWKLEIWTPEQTRRFHEKGLRHHGNGWISGSGEHGNAHFFALQQIEKLFANMKQRSLLGAA